ncbi:MAG: hypothetical protein LRY73_04135 [Bacillus sp. (in: Bacteria)]|nr:hypothetical protein [Bacillus sp. (in: firmicutes)]
MSIKGKYKKETPVITKEKSRNFCMKSTAFYIVVFIVNLGANLHLLLVNRTGFKAPLDFVIQFHLSLAIN